MHAHAHPVYMARKNLAEIALYAEAVLNLLDEQGERLPQNLFAKIVAVRTHMKDVGHFLRYESKLDRVHRKSKDRKGSANSLAPEMLSQIVEYAVMSDEVLAKVDHRIPQWVDHKLSICAQYMDCIGHHLEAEADQGRRYAGPTWNTEAGRIGIKSGFIYQAAMHRGAPPEKRRYASAATRMPGMPREPGRETVTRAQDSSLAIVIQDDGGFGGGAVGGANMNKSRPPEDFMQGLRMKVLNRMGRQNRMLARQPPDAYQPQGVHRRYGVPGFQYGEPGWAGQGGVQTFPIGSARPRAVQTYGSLGYASMGDGSMDMAARGGRRRYAGDEPLRGRGKPSNYAPAAGVSGKKLLKKGR